MSKRDCVAALSVVLGGALIGSFAEEAKAGGCWSASRCETELAAPVIHRTVKKRIQVEQGVYEIARTPSVYGWTVPVPPDAKGASFADEYGVSRRVLLKPYRNIAIYDRAKHVYVTEHMTVQPEAEGEWSWWDRLWLR